MPQGRRLLDTRGLFERGRPLVHLRYALPCFIKRRVMKEDSPVFFVCFFLVNKKSTGAIGRALVYGVGGKVRDRSFFMT